MTTYYVSPTGLSGNSGLTDTAPKPLTTTTDNLLVGGDTMILMAGTYLVTSATTLTKGGAGSYITWQGNYNGEAILKFSQAADGHGFQCGSGASGGASWRKFKDFTIDGLSNTTAGKYQFNGLKANVGTHHLWFENLFVKECRASGIATVGADYCYAINNRIWRCGQGAADLSGGGQGSGITFNNFPKASLNAGITSSQTTIVVGGGTVYPASFPTSVQLPFPIRIASTGEVMSVTATGGTANTTWTVTRGQAGTTGTAALSGAMVLMGPQDGYTGFHFVMVKNIVSGCRDSDTSKADGDGISFDIAPHNGLMANNLMYNNGGRGLYVKNLPSWSTCFVNNNTSYHNGLELAGVGEIMFQDDSTNYSGVNGGTFKIANNIAAEGDFTFQHIQGGLVNASPGMTYTKNIGFGTANQLPTAVTSDSAQINNVNPMFSNPTTETLTADAIDPRLITTRFSVLAGSPAIDNGVNPNGLTSDTNIQADLDTYFLGLGDVQGHPRRT